MYLILKYKIFSLKSEKTKGCVVSNLISELFNEAHFLYHWPKLGSRKSLKHTSLAKDTVLAHIQHFISRQGRVTHEILLIASDTQGVSQEF